MTVYVINVEGGMTKIGRSRHGALSRARDIQTYHWNRVNICAEFDGGEREEMEMHRAFESQHVSGEWFDFSAGMLLAMRNMMTAEAREYATKDDASLYRSHVARRNNGGPVGTGVRGDDVLYVPPWWFTGDDPEPLRVAFAAASSIASVTVPVRGRRGPKPTGSLIRIQRGWVARIRLADGSRKRIPVPDGYDEAMAREFAAAVQKRENETAGLFARKISCEA